jgi:iron(III) transport system substrate-binding protein
MRTLALLLGAVMLLAWGVGCGPARPEARDTLVVYSAGPRPLIESIAAAYTEATGVPVDLFIATTGQIMARLEAERFRPRADVVIFASGVAAAALKSENRLLPHMPAWLTETREDWHDPDGFYFATAAALVGVALRAEHAHPDLDWSNLLGGEFGGRTVMPSPSRSGSAGDFVVAFALAKEEDAWSAFRAARRARMDFAAANSQAITSLLIGAYDAIIGAVDYLIFRQIADGANLVMHFPPSGSALVTRPIAILASTPVPEHARRFVDFYFEPAAQEAVAAAHLLPARLDTPPSAVRGDADLPPLLAAPVEAALRAHGPTLRRFQIEIERAAVVRD